MAKKEAPKVLEMFTAMNYYSNVAAAFETQGPALSVVRIGPQGLIHEIWGRDKFFSEFYREFLEEELAILMKFLGVAWRNEGNEPEAVAAIMERIQMKLSDLKGKTMEELVSMHNEAAKPLGVKEVEKFKTLEAGRIAVVKLAKKVAGKPAKTKQKAESSGGVEGRPRTGVGAYAKEQIAKGKSNGEVLEAVKAKFPDNSTTLSCIAYYRNAMVKAGVIKSSRAEGGKKPEAKKVKGKADKKAAPKKAKKESEPEQAPQSVGAPA